MHRVITCSNLPNLLQKKKEIERIQKLKDWPLYGCKSSRFENDSLRIKNPNVLTVLISQMEYYLGLSASSYRCVEYAQSIQLESVHVNLYEVR